MRLAERFGQWPLPTQAGSITAAQALLLAEALAPDKPKGEVEIDTRLGKPKDRKLRKVPKSVIKQLANKGGELEKHDV